MIFQLPSILVESYIYPYESLTNLNPVQEKYFFCVCVC